MENGIRSQKVSENVNNKKKKIVKSEYSNHGQTLEETTKVCDLGVTLNNRL